MTVTSPPIHDTSEHRDAIALIRRGMRPFLLGEGRPGPRAARALANWALVLGLSTPALWMLAVVTAPVVPETVIVACAILALVLIPISFVLGLGAVVLTPRRIRGWIAIALVVAIVASAIGLILSSDDFGR